MHDGSGNMLAASCICIASRSVHLYHTITVPPQHVVGVFNVVRLPNDLARWGRSLATPALAI